MQALNGQVAIIASADSALGAKTAQLFVARGAQVILTGTDPAKGESLSRHIGSSTRFVGADLGIEGDVKWLVEYTLRQFGRLDSFFCDSKAIAFTESTEGDHQDIERTFARYLRSLLFCYRYVPTVMVRQGRGSVVHFNQAVGAGIVESVLARSMARAAVQDLIRLVAADFRGYSVRVNSISLGSSETICAAEQGPVPICRAAGHRSLSARTGLIERVARAAIFLASDEARLLSGYDLVVGTGPAAVTAPELSALA